MKVTVTPLRQVVASEVGPRAIRVKLPNGWAILCGVAPLRRDTLACGHVVETHGPKAGRRRCDACLRQQHQLPL